MKGSTLITALLLITLAIPARAQEDLLKMLEQEKGEQTEYAFATFKGTRIVNLQSPELPGKGVLQAVIMHRFGAFDDDFFYNFLGLDNAQVRLSLDYSPLTWLNVGLGHSSVRQTYDGFLKYRIFRQSSGKRVFPFTVTGFSSMFYSAERYNDNLPHNESDRFSYVNELIIARKFTPNFSAELTPTLVHFNVVNLRSESNDLFALGIAGRYKITRMQAICVEYVYQLNPYQYLNPETQQMNTYDNALSIGYEVETGGHVFQIFLTNASGVADPYVFAQTNGSWLNNHIHLGFNISRVFTIQKPKLPEE